VASIGRDVVTGSIPPAPAQRQQILASVGTPMPTEITGLKPALGDMNSLFSNTFAAAQDARPAELVAALANRSPRPAGMRSPDLVAPDFEHVTDIFSAPEALTSDRFAVIFDRDEADFDPTPEMGQHRIVMGVGDDTTMRSTGRFGVRVN
jgi:hypothetical protein